MKLNKFIILIGFGRIGKMESVQWKYEGKYKELVGKIATLTEIDGDKDFCMAQFETGKPMLMLKSTFEVCNDK